MLPRKDTGLTRKEAKFVKKLVSDPEITPQAAAAFAYDTKNPSSVGSVVYHKPRVQKAIREHLATVGIDEDRIAGKVNELLEATFPDGLPNHEVQRKMLDMVLKIRGDYAPDKHLSVNATGDIQNVLAAMEKQ